jgi:hypothetical protein
MYSSKNFCHALSVHNYLSKTNCPPAGGNAILIMIKERSLIKNLNLMILNRIFLIYGIAFDGFP